MKLLTSLFTAGLFTASASASVVNINFTSNDGPVASRNTTLDGTAFTSGLVPISYNGATWNDTPNGNALTNLLDSEGLTTTIGLNITDGGNTQAGFSFSYVANNSVLANYLAPNNGFGAAPASASTITITGLTAGEFYNFAFVSAGDNTTQGGDFTIGGTTLTSVNGATDATSLVEGEHFVLFSNIEATTTSIDVTWAPPTGGNQNFLALAGVQIQVVPEPSSALLLGLGGLALLRRRR